MSALSNQPIPRPQNRFGRQSDPSTNDHARPTDPAYSKPIKRESKLTFGGIIYILVTLFLAVGAINSQNNLLFWLFGVAIATLVVSGVFSGSALMQVRLEAQAIPDAFAGEPVRVHYMLTNRSRFFPLFAALISEIPDENHPKARFSPAAILHLGPRQHTRAHGSFIPTHRGRYSANRIRLSTRFPFGLVQKSIIFERHRSMLILPHQLTIAPGLARAVLGQGDQTRNRTNPSGASTEYWGLREYAPGDPKRSIAWKQSARHAKLVVIEHAQPISTKLWIWITAPCLDIEADPSGAERAIALGASLIALATTRHIPVGLWVPAYDIKISPGTGQASMMRSVRALAVMDISTKTLYDRAPDASRCDDLLVICPGKDAVPAAISGATSGRILEADSPKQWLIDPESLPDVLAPSSGSQR